MIRLENAGLIWLPPLKVFWDAVVDGVRTGAPRVSGTQYDFYFEDPALGAGKYSPYGNLPFGKMARGNVSIDIAFNGGSDAMMFGVAGASSVHDDFGTSALIDPTVVGVKSLDSAFNNATCLIGTNKTPKAKHSFSGQPSAGEATVFFGIFSTGNGWI